MTIANIHQAKSQLSQLIEQAILGQSVIISKAGKPVAKLVPYTDNPPRQAGKLKNKIWISDDFNEEIQFLS